MRQRMPLLVAGAMILSTATVYSDCGEQPVKLLANDGSEHDLFGWSVATNGAIHIVGARSAGRNGAGSAYLFDTTTAREIVKLLPNDRMRTSSFGRSVAISGATAIVGAVGDDGAGSAYLFDTTTGRQIAKLLPGEGSAYDGFGETVAMSGSIAVVGASGNDDNGDASGSAYLFDTTTGEQIAKLLPSDGAPGDRFGFSVAMSGSIAVVGAFSDDDNGEGSGSAYLFDTTTGQQIGKLLTNDGTAGDSFGISVAISGSIAVVGAWHDDDNGPNSGSAYLFDTTTGQQIAKLLPSDGAEEDLFGRSVAISDATAIVGAYADDDNGNGSGSAYLFDTTTGRQTAKLLPKDGARGDSFGFSVAIRGQTAIVGAWLDDGIGTNSGSAYVFSTVIPQTIGVPADYPTIQQAIDAVSDCDEIIVAPGIYYEAIDFRGKAIHLTSSGGSEVTTIDATGRATSVVTCRSWESADTILEGFTITGGIGRLGSNGYRRGGGMFIVRASPTVFDCTFLNNSATANGGGMYNDSLSTPIVSRCSFIGNAAGWTGGGMFNASRYRISVTDCTFVSNIAADGAGMFNSASTEASIEHCTFTGNIADGPDGRGGGVLGGAQVIGCLFTENRAKSGGAAWLLDTEMSDCTFSNNEASSDGGALALVGLAQIERCSFTRNRAFGDRATGGGIAALGGTPTLINCQFVRNEASLLGGGVHCRTNGTVIIDCVFHGNLARFGGGLHHIARIPTVLNCLFVGNRASEQGGGAFVDQAGASIVGSTFTRNEAGFAGGGLYVQSDLPVISNCLLWGDAPDEIGGGTPIVTYSDVQGGFEGKGNINADPLFARPPEPGPDGEWGTEDDDYGDVRLQAGSPCIDAADNTAVPDDFNVDLDGLARFVDDPETQDTGRCERPCRRGIVDMGAYEFSRGACCIDETAVCTNGVRGHQCLEFSARFRANATCDEFEPPCGISCIRKPEWLCDGDVDGDEQVNPVDSSLVQQAFGSLDDQDLCSYDLDCDGQINQVDSGIVQSLFGTCDPPREACPWRRRG